MFLSKRFVLADRTEFEDPKEEMVSSEKAFALSLCMCALYCMSFLSQCPAAFFGL